MAEQGLQCATCQRQTLHRQQSPNHILHFLIAFFTCGLWLIVWLIIGAKERPWLCTQCGTEYRYGAKWKAAQRPRLTPAEVAEIRKRNRVVAAWSLGLAFGGLVVVAAGLYVVAQQQLKRAPVVSGAAQAITPEEKGHDPEQFISTFGPPDIDHVNDSEMPVPPIRMRFLEYKRGSVSVTYTAGLNAPKPYRWRLVGMQDLKTGEKISPEEAGRRLRAARPARSTP